MGLFKETDTTAVVENLNLSSVNIVTTAKEVGAIAGYNRGTIQNVTVKGGNIKGGTNIGGIAGVNYGTITLCNNNGNIEGINCIGGISSFNYGTISKCANLKPITKNSSGGNGNEDCGGITGANFNSINLCYNIGDIIDYSPNGADVGGIVGQNCLDGNVQNCYNIGNITANGFVYRVGGVIGWCEGNAENCYNSGNISSGSEVEIGSVVGTCHVGDEAGTVTNTYYLIGTYKVGIGAGTGEAEGRDAQGLIDSYTDLGTQFKKDESGGYPLLSWQQDIINEQ